MLGFTIRLKWLLISTQMFFCANIDDRKSGWFIVRQNFIIRL